MAGLFPDEDLPIAPGAAILRGFARDAALTDALAGIEAGAPFRNFTTPGGRRMSVAMTNCGPLGWVSDPRGYRYQATDPETGRPWPAMPPEFRDLARRAAARLGHDFDPDACLINRYLPGTRLSLHQDRDERDMTAPIVSVSLGLPATFQFGGPRRGDPVAKYRLDHGDVVVWGGPSRLNHHGILTLRPGDHPLLGACRINLTFRKAG